MLIKNKGASWALVGLVAIVAIGFSFFDRPHCYINKRACVEQNAQHSKNENLPLDIVVIGRFFRVHHVAIEAVAAVGSLVFAGVLASFTAALWHATKTLSASTAKLSEAEEANSAELRKATELAEKQFLVVCDQADLAKKVHFFEITRFSVEHRARLAVRSVNVARATDKTSLL